MLLVLGYCQCWGVVTAPSPLQLDSGLDSGMSYPRMKHIDPWPAEATDKQSPDDKCVYKDHTGLAKWVRRTPKKPTKTPSKDE